MQLFAPLLALVPSSPLACTASRLADFAHHALPTPSSARAFQLTTVASSRTLASCSCSSLDELFYFQDKLMASMRSSIQGPADGAAFCSAWLFVLACFQNTDLEAVKEASATAVQIADNFMKAIADKVKSLMLRISEVRCWVRYANSHWHSTVLNSNVCHLSICNGRSQLGTASPLLC